MRNKTNLQRHNVLFWGNLDKSKHKISKEEIIYYIEVAIITIVFVVLFLNY